MSSNCSRTVSGHDNRPRQEALILRMSLERGSESRLTAESDDMSVERPPSASADGAARSFRPRVFGLCLGLCLPEREGQGLRLFTPSSASTSCFISFLFISAVCSTEVVF